MRTNNKLTEKSAESTEKSAEKLSNAGLLWLIKNGLSMNEDDYSSYEINLINTKAMIEKAREKESNKEKLNRLLFGG